MIARDFFNKERAAVVRNTLDNPQGEKFMEVLKEMCMVDRSCLGDTPYRTYYNEGKRDVALQIMELLKGKNDE